MNAEAQYDMGMKYRYGLGVPKNLEESLRWFRMSAENGNHDAQISLNFTLAELGDKYYDAGKYDEAISFYTQCAEIGYAYVPRKLGDMYLNGIGVEADPVKALQWYTNAANRGDIHSQFMLGDMYFSGIGSDEDKYAAYVWHYVCFLTRSGIYDITEESEDMLSKIEGFLTPDERDKAIHEAETKFNGILAGIGRSPCTKNSKGE